MVDIPDFEDIYRQDEEDEEDGADSEGNNSNDEEIEGSPRKRMKTDMVSI